MHFFSFESQGEGKGGGGVSLELESLAKQFAAVQVVDGVL